MRHIRYDGQGNIVEDVDHPDPPRINSDTLNALIALIDELQTEGVLTAQRANRIRTNITNKVT